MPLSISSSNERLPSGPYGRQWLLTLFFCFVAAGSCECYLYSQGFQPSVVDSPELWASCRNACETPDSSDMVVALGASRVLLGFSPEVFIEKTGRSETLILAIDGSNPLPALKDFALNSDFRGTVLVSVLSQHLLPPTEAPFIGRTQEYVDTYHQKYGSYGWDPFPHFETLCGRELTAVSFTIGLKSDDLKQAIQKQKQLSYFTKKRFRPTDYRNGMSAEKLKIYRNNRVAEFVAGLNRSHQLGRSPDELLAARPLWMKGVKQAWAWAQMIEERGGRVVFIRFPTSGGHWEADQQAFPKELFWDYAAERSPIEMIHFWEIPGAKDFDCPDTSHLNIEDAEKFTALIAEELVKRGIIVDKAR